MNLRTPFYFCTECKKSVAHLDDLLFIDESSYKGFCSEECIEDFYVPLIKHYEIIENSLRKKHSLLDENGLGHIVDAALVDEVLEHPNEVFRQTNELKESFYHFIKNFLDFSVVVVTSVYRQEASFVFLTTKTKSRELLNEFRYGEKIIDWQNLEETSIDEPDFLEFRDDEVAIDEEVQEDEDMVFIQLLESKKSRLLADILMKRKEDSDIPFEDYSGYESCFQETLDFPDEVFEKKDNEGDVIFSYIKSFSNFFYIVSCLKRKHPDSLDTTVYPVLALPTTDLELCQEFRAGVKLSGPLKN
jgi:hypothetical protein